MNEDCLKLTTYFGERGRVGDRYLADALIAIYARHELQLARHSARVNHTSDVVLHETARIPRLTRTDPKTLLERCEGARPADEIHERGPNHYRYVQHSPDWVVVNEQSAGDRKRDEKKMPQQHEVSTNSIEHLPSVVG